MSKISFSINSGDWLDNYELMRTSFIEKALISSLRGEPSIVLDALQVRLTKCIYIRYMSDNALTITLSKHGCEWLGNRVIPYQSIIIFAVDNLGTVGPSSDS